MKGGENMDQNNKLSPEQVDTLARSLVYMADKIIDYYKDPNNEKKFQKWHYEEFGCYAPPLE